MRKVFLLLKFLLAFCSIGYSQVLDPSFGNAGKVVLAGVKADLLQVPIAVQTDGKIVVAGYTADGTDVTICRLNSNGTFDNSFGSNGKVTLDLNGTTAEGLTDLKIQSDGKIVVSGNAAVARLNTNGSPDLNFNSTGKLSVGIQVKRMLLQTDGKIILAGNNGPSISLIRLNSSNGSMDASFGSGGTSTFPTLSPFPTDGSPVTGIVQQSDNKIVVSGFALNPATSDIDFYSIRFNTNGSIDNSYASVGYAFIDINNLFNFSSHAINSGDKSIISGSGLGNPNEMEVVRLNGDGSPDNSFNFTGKVSTSIMSGVSGLTLQSDGKILLAGLVTTQANDFGLARLNTDGSIDNSINGNGILSIDFGNSNDQAANIAALQDGQILMTGRTSVNGVFEVCLTRILTIQRTYYRDNDGDGFGNNTVTTTNYFTPQGYVTNNTDCNDNSNSVYPGATEICGNSIDDDCDGQVDEGCNTNLPRIYLSFQDAVREGNNGLTNAQFSIYVYGDRTLPVSIQYRTVDGSAIAPYDYVSKSGVLTFQPGETIKTINVQVRGDRLDEYVELFFFEIFNPVNAIIDNYDYSVGLIIDDDPSPTIRINNAITSENNRLAQVRVELSEASGQVVRVMYDTRNGTARAPGDYTAISNGILEFQPGETAKNISVVINQDALNESTERFEVRLKQPTNAIIARQVADVRITNSATVLTKNAPNATSSAEEEESVSISPNPTNQLLNLRPFIKAGPNKLNIQLIDQSGRVVKQWTNSYSAEGQLISLPVADVASGIYMIVIQDGKIRRLQQKVVIQH